MAESDTNPLSMDAPPKAPSTSKKALIGIIVVGVLAAISMVIATLGLLAVTEVDHSSKQGFAQARQYIDTQLNEVKAEPELSEEQMARLSSSVADSLKTQTTKDTEALVQQFFDANGAQLVESAAALVNKKRPVDTRKVLSEEDVIAIVDTVFTNRSQALVQRMAGIEKLLNENEQKRLTTLAEIDRLRSQIQNLSTAPTSSRSTVESEPEPKRLKEFNLIDVLKDGKLFVLDAPKKNGKANSITLTVGEGFYSKYGKHRVVRAEHPLDRTKRRLIISGGWFIDDVREELTQSELDAIAAEKAAAKQAARKSKQQRQKIAEKEKQQRVAQNANEKLYLKGWKVVAPIKESNRVVVYNPNKAKAEQLHINQYVAGLGTVRTIDLSSGETCFEKYCIAGNNF